LLLAGMVGVALLVTYKLGMAWSFYLIA